MKFNIAPSRKVRVPSGAYKTLTESELAALTDGDTTVSGISVSSETLGASCILGARYKLDSLVYYRDAADTENISIFGQQGQTSDYNFVELSYTEEGGIITVDLSSANDRYEVITLVHTVTAGSATVFELEIYTAEEDILFGEDGQASVYSVDSGTSTLGAERVSIYNPSTIVKEMYCVLDSEDEDSTSLSLSTSSSDIFHEIYSVGLSVPSDFAWSSGQLDNTVESSGDVVLSPASTSGTYYTPVIDISSLQGRRLFWRATATGTTEIDDYGSDDSAPVIGVRLSNTTPSDGGWVSGQMSTDSNWHVDTGAIPFVPYDNNHILGPLYPNYFQARLELHSQSAGATPILTEVGVEEGIALTISGGSFTDIYVKSSYTDHVSGRDAKIVVWHFEDRNEEQ